MSFGGAVYDVILIAVEKLSDSDSGARPEFRPRGEIVEASVFRDKVTTYRDQRLIQMQLGKFVFSPDGPSLVLRAWTELWR